MAGPPEAGDSMAVTEVMAPRISLPDAASSARGSIFDIERFATHDGPGTRTTVFLKGCFLRCAWCHNPEAISSEPELMYDPGKCIHCLTCFPACPHDDALYLVNARGERVPDEELPRYSGAGAEPSMRVYDQKACDRCGSCAEVCYAEALEMVGREISAAEAYEEAARDRPFYGRTGGGVTVSGGEPLYQRAFTEELLRRCHDSGLHTAMDTTAYGKWETLAAMLDHVDLVLLDLKHMDNLRHLEHTGVENTSILENAARLAGHIREREGGAESAYPPQNTGIWVRVPVIPTINDDEDNLRATARFVAEQMGGAVKVMELLGYHQLGGSKFQRLGREAPLPGVEPPGREYLEGLRQLVEEVVAPAGVEVRAR